MRAQKPSHTAKTLAAQMVVVVEESLGEADVRSRVELPEFVKFFNSVCQLKFVQEDSANPPVAPGQIEMPTRRAVSSSYQGMDNIRSGDSVPALSGHMGVRTEPMLGGELDVAQHNPGSFVRK
jgi:glutaminase